jgi:carboxylesterase type B
MLTTGAPSTLAVINETGCTGQNALACLRLAPVDRLVQAAPDAFFEPVADGDTLVDPAQQLVDGDVIDVPVIVGNNRDEATFGAFVGTPSGIDNDTSLFSWLTCA